jgi:Holliday junction resolvase
VDDFNNSGWTARRLGGSSTGLPDVVATSSGRQMLFSMECKSTLSDACYIPNDQLMRCRDILHMFNVYPWRYIVLAFKFAKPKTKGKKLQYWYVVVDDYLNIENIRSVKFTRAGKLELYLNTDDSKTYFITRIFTSLKEIKEMRTYAYKPVNDKLLI